MEADELMAPSVLKLLAEDAEGLGIIASAVQDALVKPQDIKFDTRSRTFGLEINRFQWERAGKRMPFFRSRAVLAFAGVFPLGALMSGLLAGHFGVQATLALAGLGALAVVLHYLRRLPRLSARLAGEYRRLGLPVYGDLIIGLPGQTPNPITWKVEQGRVTEITGGEEAEKLKKVIDGVPGATVIGEFASC